MKTLQLSFQNEVGKSRALNFKYADTNASEATVRRAMEQIAAAQLISKDDVFEYAKPISAKYVERIETPIFNDKQK